MLPLPTPHLTIPLIAALVIDLAIRRPVATGVIDPLTMNARAAGVIGAAVISLAVGALLGTAGN